MSKTKTLELLKAWKSNAYCRFLDELRKDKCLGVDMKIEEGRFGREELEAHCKAHEHYGKHLAYSEATKLLREEAGR